MLQNSWQYLNFNKSYVWRYESKPEDWSKYAKWDKFKYTRNLIHEGTEYMFACLTKSVEM